MDGIRMRRRGIILVALSCLAVTVGGMICAGWFGGVLESPVLAASEQGGADSEGVSEAAAGGGGVAEQTWMDRVDTRFGQYLVAPLAKTLFYDFGTQDLQLRHLLKQDVDGDGEVSRAEARGRVARAFETLDKDDSEALSVGELAVLTQ